MAVISRPMPRTERRQAVGGKLLREGLHRLVMFGGLAIFTVWTLFPLVWIVTSSIKSDRELYRIPGVFPKDVTWVHYRTIFEQTRFMTYFKNSLMVASLTTVVSIVAGVRSEEHTSELQS